MVVKSGTVRQSGVQEKLECLPELIFVHQKLNVVSFVNLKQHLHLNHLGSLGLE